MKRIAVAGSGISGLAAAYLLSRKHEVTLFERDARLGGHTHTHSIETPEGVIAVDTGFIVHNDRTYPNLIRLLRGLGVETRPSDMSFAVTCHRTGYEWSSRGLAGFFAQPANALRPRHYRLLAEILRFNREAPRLLEQPGADGIALSDWLRDQRFSSELAEFYLVPMAGAVWSTSPESMMSFPALTLIRFFHNHGMLGVNSHPRWRVLEGGSSTYLAPITRPFAGRIEMGAGLRLSRREQGVVVKIAGRPDREFDEAVLACHGDQVLDILEDPSPSERSVFTQFRTSRNETCLHTDQLLLPKRPAARASWNYNVNLNGRGAVTVTYDMNRLQSIRTRDRFLVTLNGHGAVNPDRILRRMVYEHPLYTRESVRAQQRWNEVSGVRHTHFAGAYWFYGFHEDGLNSAIRVARALGVEW